MKFTNTTDYLHIINVACTQSRFEVFAIKFFFSIARASLMVYNETMLNFDLKLYVKISHIGSRQAKTDFLGTLHRTGV